MRSWTGCGRRWFTVPCVAVTRLSSHHCQLNCSRKAFGNSKGNLPLELRRYLGLVLLVWAMRGRLSLPLGNSGASRRGPESRPSFPSIAATSSFSPRFAFAVSPKDGETAPWGAFQAAGIVLAGRDSAQALTVSRAVSERFSSFAASSRRTVAKS